MGRLCASFVRTIYRTVIFASTLPCVLLVIQGITWLVVELAYRHVLSVPCLAHSALAPQAIAQTVLQAGNSTQAPILATAWRAIIQQAQLPVHYVLLSSALVNNVPMILCASPAGLEHISLWSMGPRCVICVNPHV